MDPNIPVQPVQPATPEIQIPQPIAQSTYQQSSVSQPMQATNAQEGGSSMKTKITRILKIIGFIVLGFFTFSLTLNQQSISLPLGLFIGLILLMFKAKGDRKIRFAALILGFLFLIYTPYLSQSIAQSVLQPNNVYSQLKALYPSAAFGVQTIETGFTATFGSVPTESTKTPSQLVLTLTQDKLLTDQEMKQTAVFLCKNTHYNIVTVTSIKVLQILIPLPFVNQTKSLGGRC